eukprot:SAG11_NODE_5320_length_1597_cov_1.766355_1_plen_211_part_10
MQIAAAPALGEALLIAREAQSPLLTGLRRLVTLALHQHHRGGARREGVLGELAAILVVDDSAALVSPAELALDSLRAGWTHTRLALGAALPAGAGGARLLLRIELGPSGGVGLRNLGNTCFCNAFLQALHATLAYRCPLLLCDFRTARSGDSTEGAVSLERQASQRKLLLALQRLHGTLLLSATTSTSAADFLAALPPWDCIAAWRRSRQQ